jgi:hypothetical protein
MKLFTVIAVIVYSLLVLSEEIQFELWGQVEYIHQSDPYVSDLLDYEQLTHGHVSRYLLVLPVYYFESEFGFDKNYLFSVYVLVVVLVASFLYANVLRSYVSEDVFSAYAKSFIGISGLSLMMNGRIVFALLAMVILIWQMTRFYVGSKDILVAVFVSSFFAIWLGSVSSGTYTVIYLAYSLWLFWIVIGKTLVTAKINRRVFKMAIGIGVPLLINYPLLSYYMGKNYSYYEGDLVSMLHHGLGGLMLKLMDNMLFIPIFIGIIGALFFIYFSFQYKERRPLVYLTVMGVFGGLFGYSTLVLVLPSVVLLIYIALHMYKFRLGCIRSIDV